ncbi:MAG: heavy metal-binding domain-containing protein [Bacteroidia bacterium]
MKKQLVLISATVLMFLSVESCKSPKSATNNPASAAVYTCPMHPEITSDKPGKCSKCGMDLVKK